MRTLGALALAVLIFASLGSCGEEAKLALSAGMGPHPALPEPQAAIIPTMQLTRAVGWPESRKPNAPPDLQVTAYAAHLDHPRWIYVLPDGDVLVAETSQPDRPADTHGILGFVARRAMNRVGADVRSAERITLLRGVDANGAAKTRSVFLEHLHSPFGMSLVGEVFYVANTDSVQAFHYHTGELQISGTGTTLTNLPAGPINHHWTKNLIASPDGTKLYVTVGSNSNAAENGIAAETERAAIWEVDIRSGQHRIFASGLRNPNGLAWEPETSALWTAVNERDDLGGDLVPDYMTAVADGGFYGFPYSYFGAHIDERVRPPRADLLARTLVPDYALGAHTASIGLAFASGESLPVRLRHGAFIGQHGSWNRKPLSGYQVIFVRFENGRPAGEPELVLSGFLNRNGEAMGRPVGVAMDAQGALLVADDVGNTVWRVGAAHPESHHDGAH